MREIKLFEMFAGYGGSSFALQKAGIPFKCVGYSEIDKFAIQCYDQNHFEIERYPHNDGENSESYIRTNSNFGDCTNINPEDLPDFDLLTGGFPCQAFSVAGKGIGEADTRGTLFHEIIRIAEIKQPRWILLENVKGLTIKRHSETFKKILSELDRIGYSVRWDLMNTKEHGIPQNRERVFFVCFRDSEDWEKFTGMPEKEDLKLYLKDIVEKKVDAKYYLSKEMVERLLYTMPEKVGTNAVITPNRKNKNQNGRRIKEDGEPMFTLSSNEPHKILQINNPKHSNDRVYSIEGCSPTLNTMQGGRRQPFILVKNATAKGYLKAYPGDGVNLEHPNSKTRRGRVQQNVIGALQCSDARGIVTRELTIRKLTPKECFRLMGFLKDEINVKGISNSQQYKLAGNGWDINLVSKIFKQMFKEED